MVFSRTIKVVVFISVIIGGFYVAHKIYRKKQLQSYEEFHREEDKLAQEIFESTKDKKNPKPDLEQERIKILVIEGGGAKGLYALRVLDYLEKKTGKPISQLYDVMGGTSIGSLLVSLLSIPKDGKPKFSAHEILDVFAKVAHKTLNPSLKQKILSGYGLLSPILANQKYIKELQSVYGNALLSDSLNHLILYGFNFNTNKIVPFHSRGESLDALNPLLYQLVGGTTSPFGIAPPNKVRLNFYSKPEFIGDAAHVINNPLLAIIFEVSKIYPNKKLLINFITLHPIEMGYTADFAFFSGEVEAIQDFPLYIQEGRNQLIRDYINTLAKSNVYKFDLLVEIGLRENSEWRDLDSFDFSEKNLTKIDEFSSLILNENKTVIDKVAKELLSD